MILVDTGPLVAICDPRDGQHARAKRHLARLAPTGLRICDAVLTETCFHLPNQMQRRRLRAVIDELDIESLPTHDRDFYDDVFGWLIKYADHEPDWADGCLVALCSRDPGLKVWTYDRGFQTTWRRLDGRGIPMAVR